MPFDVGIIIDRGGGWKGGRWHYSEDVSVANIIINFVIDYSDCHMSNSLKSDTVIALREIDD